MEEWSVSFFDQAEYIAFSGKQIMGMPVLSSRILILLKGVEREGTAAGVGLAGEGGDADTVLVRDLNLDGRDAMMGT